MSIASPTAAFSALRANYRADLLSGFMVALIALPLSLGIAAASGFPPIAGLITAIIGGVLASHLGSAPLTIKGPAAGLIAIVIGAVTELGDGDAMLGYKRTLAVGVVAASLQIVLALSKAGKLADFFPTSVVHGMLAAIGVIILAKQIYLVVGAPPHAKEPLALLAGVPEAVRNFNPMVLVIGAASLGILFAIPMLPWPRARRIPAPMVVVALAIALSHYYGFEHEHAYFWGGIEHIVGPAQLVHLPGHLLDAITFPDFGAILTGPSIKYIVMFTLVASLESVLSAKAVDTLDPKRSRSDMDADLLSAGAANLACSLLGGLPMISEIVRSSANINNGAKSQWSNFFHGAFLLLALVVFPGVLQMIPLAALGAMLVYTGLRLASPTEWKHAWHVGPEQLAIFMTTLIMTLATDLLVGVASGIALKFVVHAARGVTLGNFFSVNISETTDGDTTTLACSQALVFSNYLALKKRVLATTAKVVVLDMADTTIVDHTVLEKVPDLEGALAAEGRKLITLGLDQHTSFTGHATAARISRASIRPPA